MKLVLAIVLLVGASSLPRGSDPPVGRDGSDRKDVQAGAPTGIDGGDAAVARQITHLVDRLEPKDDELVSRLRSVLPSLAGQVALRRQLDQLRPAARAAVLEDRLQSFAAEYFVADGDVLRVRSDPPELRTTLLEWIEAVGSELDRLDPLLARVARGLPEYPPIDGDLAEVLVVPGAPAIIASTTPSRAGARRSAKARDPFFETSPLGSSLLERPDGSWRVNPYRRREVATLVRRLGRRLADHATLSPRVRELAARLTDTEVRAALESDAGRAWVSVTLGRDGREPRVNACRSWRTRHLGPDGSVRPVARDALESLLRNAEAIGPDIEAAGPAIGLDLSAMTFRSEHVHLLRSSCFYNPRTKRGRTIYETEFPDHHAARLFGVFDMPAIYSRDPASFRRRLASRNAWVRDLGRTHDKLLVYLSVMPKWLSVSSDERIVGDGPAYRKYPPRDYAVWAQLVRDLVRFLRQLDGVTVYYEIWNEPGGYWLADVEEFLRLYEVTAKVIRSEDPRARVGGAAANPWDSRLRASPDREPINLELIRHVRRRGLPLDFVSWHHFGRPPSEIARAKEAFAEALGTAAGGPRPEFVVSEWSIRHRGTSREAVAFAEMMLGLYRAEVDMHMVSAWEEFAVIPDPAAFRPWGMLTRQGMRKPMFFVHQFFDRLSRDTDGIAVVEDPERNIRIVLSRKRDGSFEMVIWTVEHAPALVAAMEPLRAGGVTGRRLARYGNVDDLEAAIRHDRPRDDRDREAFRLASAAYHRRMRDDRPRWVRLEITDARRVDVLDCRSVGDTVRDEPAAACGRELLLDLAANEVVWLRFAAIPCGGDDTIDG